MQLNDPYKDWVFTYKSNAFHRVEGWVDDRLFDVLVSINNSLTVLNVIGGVLEIGVHHGRFFLPLNAMADENSTSFAIDVFEDQQLNIDNSGCGNRGRFEENLREYDKYSGLNVKIMQHDSTRLRYGDLSQFRSSPPKIISIDGGHTVEHTVSDLLFSESIVHSSGVVILDDILNAHWVGVFEGAVTYLQRKPSLWPVFIGYNKLILVPMSVHAFFLKKLQESFPSTKLQTLCGYTIITPI